MPAAVPSPLRAPTLFVAVLEQTEQQMTDRVAQVLGQDDVAPLDALIAGAEAWLDACAAPDVQRIVLIDAPAVLGWEEWRRSGRRYGRGRAPRVRAQRPEQARAEVGLVLRQLVGALAA